MVLRIYEADVLSHYFNKSYKVMISPTKNAENLRESISLNSSYRQQYKNLQTLGIFIKEPITICI